MRMGETLKTTELKVHIALSAPQARYARRPSFWVFLASGQSRRPKRPPTPPGQLPR